MSTTILNPKTARPLGQLADRIVRTMAGVSGVTTVRRDWPLYAYSFAGWAETNRALKTLYNSGLLITPEGRHPPADPERLYHAPLTLSPLALVLLDPLIRERDERRHAAAAERKAREEEIAREEAARDAYAARVQRKLALCDALLGIAPDIAETLERDGHTAQATALRALIPLDTVN